MTTNKKLIVTVSVLAIALVLALTGIIVVLVNANQRASSAVNIKFTSTDVEVTLTATAYIGNTSYNFTKGGVEGGETTLVLTPRSSEGSLSQPASASSIALSKENNYVVFEYVFANNTDDIDVKIEQDAIPATKENINMTYTYSDTRISDFVMLEDNTEFTTQLLPAYEGEETVKYVYIKAQIADLLYDSSLEGDFGWALSKPQDSDVNTVTLSVNGADYIERSGSNLTNTSVASDYTYKTFATTVDTEDISIVPAVANKAFVGWSETEGGTVISAIDLPSVDFNHNALRGTTATTLYPVYKDGTTGISYTYSNNEFTVASTKVSTTATEFVIPDYYNDGTNAGKVTKMASGSSSKGVMNGNATVTSATLSRYLTNVGSYAFYNCTSLVSVAIPSSVDYIHSHAFESCSNLTNITFQNGLKSIQELAFSTCSNLTSIVIPKSVTSVYSTNPFRSCSSLTSVVVEEGNTVYDSRDNCNAVIKTETNFLVSGCKTTTIPNSVTIIGSGAFRGCSDLASITIPNSVQTIYSGAFLDCDSLTTIDIPSSIKSLSYNSFDEDTTVNFTSRQSIIKCGGLKISKTAVNGEIVIITEITQEDLHGLTSVSISDVDTITSIDIPEGVKSRYIYQCNNLTNFNVPEGVTSISVNNCKGITNMELPNSVTDLSFCGCENLKTVNIPNGVKTISYSAFSGCTSLESITIPNSVTNIDFNVFSGCTGLKSITIPSSVTYIGYWAFLGCTGLLTENGGSGIIFEDTTSTWTVYDDTNYGEILSTYTPFPLGYQNAAYLTNNTIFGGSGAYYLVKNA